jgi:hypothetical protein
MTDKERRREEEKKLSFMMKRELNDDQRITLNELERFGWELKFIRRPPFKPIIPVIFDGDRKTFAILEEDGTLNEHPPFKIRD